MLNLPLLIPFPLHQLSTQILPPQGVQPRAFLDGKRRHLVTGRSVRLRQGPHPTRTGSVLHDGLPCESKSALLDGSALEDLFLEEDPTEVVDLDIRLEQLAFQMKLLLHVVIEQDHD